MQISCMAKSSAAKNTSLQLPPLCGHDRKAYWWACHKRPHCTLLLWMLLSIFVACFAACHRSSSSSKRRHATCANLFTVIVCCQIGGGRGSLSGPLFVGLHTLPTSLGSMPAKRLARLSSPASASAYLDIIRSAALQPPTPPSDYMRFQFATCCCCKCVENHATCRHVWQAAVCHKMRRQNVEKFYYAASSN